MSTPIPRARRPRAALQILLTGRSTATDTNARAAFNKGMDLAADINDAILPALIDERLTARGYTTGGAA